MDMPDFTSLCLIVGILFLFSMIMPTGACVLFNERDNVNLLSLIRFPSIIAASSFALISIVFGFHTEVLTQYDDPYKHISQVKWTSPESILAYPAEQLFLQKEKVRKDVGDTIVFDNQKAFNSNYSYSFLFINDNTISSNNQFFIDSARAIADSIKKQLNNEEYSSGLHSLLDSLDIRQLISLYGIVNYTQTLTDTFRKSHYIRCINYAGRKANKLDTTILGWDNCEKMIPPYCKAVDLTYIKKYIQGCQINMKIANDSARVRRTDIRDFLDIANLKYNENDAGNADNKHFGSVIIVSDFYHEFAKNDQRDIVMGEIEGKVKLLVENPRIKQIILLRIPYSSEDSEKPASQDIRDQIMSMFHIYAQGNKAGGQKKLYTYDFLNTKEALPMLAATVHPYTMVADKNNNDTSHTKEDIPGISMYHPFSEGFKYGNCNGKFCISFKDTTDKDKLVMKFTSLVDDDKKGINLVLSRGEGEEDMLWFNCEKLLEIKNNGPINCQFNGEAFDINKPYRLEIFSPKTNQKQNVRISFLPYLSRNSGWALLLLYTLFITSIAIILCMYVVEIFLKIRSEKRMRYKIISVVLALLLTYFVLCLLFYPCYFYREYTSQDFYNPWVVYPTTTNLIIGVLIWWSHKIARRNMPTVEPAKEILSLNQAIAALLEKLHIISLTPQSSSNGTSSSQNGQQTPPSSSEDIINQQPSPSPGYPSET